MRLLTYVSPSDGRDHAGVLDEGTIRGLPADVSVLGLLRTGGADLRQTVAQLLDQPWEVVPYSDVQLRAPITVPPSIRDFSSFREHVQTCNRALTGRDSAPYWWEEPMFYFSNPAAVIGVGEDVPASPGSMCLDYELELAVVIGRDAYNVSVEEAASCIAGYTIMNDWSARDIQGREMTTAIGPAKTKDWATTVGPVLVTPDELEPELRDGRLALEMTAQVNGREYSRGSAADMYWTFPEMIAHAARGTWLRAGDILGSGTVGTGCVMELGLVHGHEKYPWLVEGDVVTLEVEGLGTQTNRIVAGPPLQVLR